MTRHTQLRPLILMVALAALALGACGSGAATGEPVRELDEIRIVLLPYSSYSPFQIGVEWGLFEAEGLKLVPVDVRRSSEAVPGLTEGEIDVVPGLLYPGLFNSIGRGAPIRVVAGAHYLSENGCTSHAMLTRSGLLTSEEASAGEALQGARVSVNPPSLSGFITDTALETVGLSLGEVEIVDLPPPAEPEAFAEGELDASFVGEPRLTHILDQGSAEIWHPAKELLPNQQFAAVFFGPSLLEDNPELGSRFLRAYLRTLEVYSQGKNDRNKEIVAQFLELDPEFVNSICWASYPEDGTVRLESVVEFQHWAVEQGYQDDVLEIEEFWEPGPLEAALGQASGIGSE